jgi:hypothetical protein
VSGLYGFDVTVLPDSDERFKGLAADECPVRGRALLVRESQWPAMKAALVKQGVAHTGGDTRKVCTCDGAGRGPGRACVVQAGGRLGDLWRCAQGLEAPR